jgi:hypothetical protein|tara:strand:+ start:163 stop:426 length:264 start_codon:yes stop_codon:yes gene_type:complete
MGGTRPQALPGPATIWQMFKPLLIKYQRPMKKIKLTQNEVDNLLDVLNEWYNCDTLGVKELENNEIGLNDDRYQALIKKLKNENKRS